MPMLATLALTFALQQAPIPFMLPAGSSPEIARGYSVLAALAAKGDFAGARAQLRLLPVHGVKVEWDDRLVPPGSQSDFAKQRDAAFSEWMDAVQSSTRFDLVKSGADLKIMFAPSGGPTLAWSVDPASPRLTATLGLSSAGSPVDPAAIHNAVSYAVGSYFGVNTLPIAGLVMSGGDMSGTQPIRPSRIFESPIAVRNLAVRDRVADALMHSQKIPTDVPKLTDPPKATRAGPILQGKKLDLSFPFSNSGGAPLDYRLIPDCSCFTQTRGVLKPGETVSARAIMDTTEFAGEVHKKLYLFTNDPARGIVEIPVDVQITRRYRMLPPIQTFVTEGDSLTVEAYLYAPPEFPLGVRGASIQGLPAEVSYVPWKGELADPDLGEGPIPRTGYKFTIKIADIPAGSRLGTNVMIDTDDPDMPSLAYPVFFQRGILAPPSLFLGEIGAAPRKTYFLLSRPGKPFKVTSISADSAHLSLQLEPGSAPGEYRVVVIYDGKASSGDYQATISVKTDDPKQSLIEVPVRATVR